jgi:hypothetical protein
MILFDNVLYLEQEQNVRLSKSVVIKDRERDELICKNVTI